MLQNQFCCKWFLFPLAVVSVVSCHEMQNALISCSLIIQIDSNPDLGCCGQMDRKRDKGKLWILLLSPALLGWKDAWQASCEWNPLLYLYSCYCHFCDLLHILCSIVIFHDFFQVMASPIQIGTGVFLYHTPITVCIPLNSLEALKFASECPM